MGLAFGAVPTVLEPVREELCSTFSAQMVKLSAVLLCEWQLLVASQTASSINI